MRHCPAGGIGRETASGKLVEDKKASSPKDWLKRSCARFSSERMGSGFDGSTRPPGLLLALFDGPASKSRGGMPEWLATSEPGVVGRVPGLETGDTSGEVCIAAGTLEVVSKTKKASPPSPSFIA